MINKKELQTYANKIDLNLGQAEKNYLHIKTLFAISKLFPDTLIFKGGTSLMICNNLDRFSEDLDFTLTDKTKLKEIISKIKQYLRNQDISFEIEKEETTKISQSFIIRFNGPLYAGSRQTTSKIEIDISFREPTLLPTKTTKINHPYNDTPVFYIQTMSLEEIFAEKIRALITRNKARDLFDLNYLIDQNIKPNLDLINKKLSYYKETFSKEKLKKSIDNKENIWRPELSNLINIIPEFNKTKNKVLNLF